MIKNTVKVEPVTIPGLMPKLVMRLDIRKTLKTKYEETYPMKLKRERCFKW
jgi:hypothetical protein